MSESSRYLRFLIPGALFQFLFGAWLLLDNEICDCYGVSTEFPDGLALALVAVAAFPIGFVSGAFASFIAWRARAGHGWANFLLRQWDDGRIARDHLGSLRKLGVTRGANTPEMGSVLTDAALHLLEAKPTHSAAAKRMSSLLDLVNALSNGIASVVLAAIGVICAALGTTVYIQFFGDGSLDLGRISLLVGWLVGLGTVLVLLIESERRVSRVCEFYLSAIRQLWRNQRTLGSRDYGSLRGLAYPSAEPRH
jgi:hypothetical protein